MKTLTPLLLLALTACEPGVDFPALDDTGDLDSDTDVDTDNDTEAPDDGWDDERPTSDFAWRDVTEASLQPYGGPPVTVLTELQTDGEWIAALGGSAVYVSDDRGTSWTRSDPGEDFSYGRSLSVDGDDLYVGAWGGIWHSADQGGSWTRLDNQVGERSLDTVQASAGVLLASASDQQPHLRVGESWQAVSLPQPSARVLLDDAGDLLAVVPFQDDLYASDDGGSTWTLRSDEAVSMVDHVDGELIIGRNGLDGTLRRSADGGVTWTDLGKVSLFDTVLYQEGTFYVSTNGSGLLTSTDGRTFTSASQGLPRGESSSLHDVVVLADGDVVASTFAPSGVYTRDDGAPFTRVSEGLDGGAPHGATLHDGELVASFGQQGLWRETDGVWTQLATEQSGGTEGFGAVASTGELLVVATGSTGLITSADGGQTWSDDGGRLPTYNGSAGEQSVGFWDLSVRGTWVFAATNLAWEGAVKGSKTPVGGGASLMADGGGWEWATWGMPLLGTNSWGDPYYASGRSIEAQPDRVLLGTAEHGVYVSEDRGETWERSTGVGAEAAVGALAWADDTWLASTGDEIYASTEGGYRWSPQVDGLPDEGTVLDVISADDTAFALVGGAQGGLFRLDGSTWSRVAERPPGVTLRAPLYQQDGLFLVGTGSRGFFQVVP